MRAVFLLLFFSCLLGCPTPKPSDEPVDFARDVRPLLARRCVPCHGPDAMARRANLRLDTRDGLFQPREGRPAAVVPGSPDESLVFTRARSADAPMPPASAGERLDAEELDVLRRWITQGAPFDDHWAFTAPARPPVPPLTDWGTGAIDALVLQALREKGLEPSPEADRETLLRRVSFDLTGLPPTPEEVTAFLADRRPDAFERVVDAKLASAEYGEHRAHHWLDLARYADTHGFHQDGIRDIWPYRDWVVAAFNDNMPFDRFTIEQLAGDLLPDTTDRQRVATGFIRCAMSTNEGGTFEAEYAAIAAKDRVEVLAAGWLGLTAGCASCHDHKYDPISHDEFYALTAFFRNGSQPVFDRNLRLTPPLVRDPVSAVETLVTDENATEPHASVLERGQFDRPLRDVGANVPRALGAIPPLAPRNRLGLARWLMSDTHPLAARVNVNRFWAQLFGAGLVRTTNDFGTAGARPSNQALLDWLAVEFRESKWDVKRLFKTMVMSATYRQSSRCSEAARRVDPENRLFSCMPRFRMDAEVLRDLALAASGLLVRQVGGPPVKPYQPSGVWEAVAIEESNTREYVQDHGVALYRRSLYTFWKRAAPPPSMELFDAPNRTGTVSQRERTATPLQALVLMNDPQRVEAARVLGSLAAQPNAGQGDLDVLALRVLGRRFSTNEKGVLQQRLDTFRRSYQRRVDLAEALLTVGEFSADGGTQSAAESAAWTMIASIVLNLDEAVNK